MRERGRGNPVILIHGLGGSIESWTNNFDSLSKHARVVALDLPGFGKSDNPPIDYTIAFYRDFLVRFVKRLGLSKISIVGSSLGGQIACEVAIARPDLVDRLIIVSPAGALPRSFKGTPALKRYIKILSARSAKDVKRFLFAVDRRPVDDSYADMVFKRMAQPNSRRAFMSALKASAAAPRLQSRLQSLESPMLLIWGKEDTMIPVRYFRPFMRMKNCRIVLLEHSGHRPHAERPETFNAVVSGFLNETT
jgi:pimeloyl-ACP methyl ester carboxylesterase